jgi:Tol biopolymer transport system component
MTLQPGTRLGPYEILSAIGAGGMGEVYRARDTKLGRDVAIKVLPESVATDPERLARFHREAQVLASLNHPNIAHIHGYEESGGIHALVMELVEGSTLTDRIARGPLPLNEVLPLAKQIAEALEAAHEQGIIHRDLKPANIKVREDGAVKVLDFGLAKLIDPVGVPGRNPNVTASPTITSPAMMTGVGVILGTAAYMSPEQAAGKPADKRSDVWAFGCVLYEMLTGRRAFGGEDMSDTLANILKSEPDWNVLPADVPPAVRTLLARCLAKEWRRRISDMSTAQFLVSEYSDLAVAPAAARAAFVGRPSSLWRRWGASGAAVLAGAVVTAVGLRLATKTPAEPHPVRFVVPAPDGWNLTVGVGPTTTGTSFNSLVAVSPDGERVGFVARNRSGDTQLWVRGLDTLNSVDLPGTDGASSPFWSPDSKWLGFFASGKLKKIALAGGPPVTLCDAANSRGAAWSSTGVIVFGSPVPQSPLQKVSAGGGTPSDASTLAQGESGHWRPLFLPDGRHVLYRAMSSTPSAGGPIFIGSLDSSERRMLLNVDSENVAYSRGHLVFLRETTLMAQPFDAQRLELSGEAFPIAGQIATMGGPTLGVFSASDSGVLVYQSAWSSKSQLTWFDRAGHQLSTLGDKADYFDVRLSPDGTRAAIAVRDEAARTRDIWIYDVARETRTRFTSDPADELSSVWSPDAQRIVFNSGRKGRLDLYQKATNGSGSEELLLADPPLNKHPMSWSPDGRFLLFFTEGAATSTDIWALPFQGDRKPFPLLQTPSSENIVQFSPDGKWMAYYSEEGTLGAGHGRIYVSPFPGPSSRVQISTEDGAVVYPRWRRDGRELYYLNRDGDIRAAAIKVSGSILEGGTVQTLFRFSRPPVRYPYDVSADGQRFLVMVPVDQSAATPLTVVMNWQSDVKK